MDTKVSSATKEVIIGEGKPTVIIGERINPTGRKKMLESLKIGDLEIVKTEAVNQVQAGADILDVHVGGFNIDEVKLLPEAIKLVSQTVTVPLCIDTTNAEALAAALKVYQGKALINSVSGEEHSLLRVLPLVKEYNAAVIGLLQDDDGIPPTVEKRVEIAHKIAKRAAAAGISMDNLVIDCLALAVGANPKSALIILETIRRVKKEIGCNITLAASNFSFGMPSREMLSGAFIAMVIEAGATCLITDAAKYRSAILSADLVVGRDQRARRFLQAFRQIPKPQ